MDEILHKRIHGLQFFFSFQYLCWIIYFRDTVPPRPSGTREEPRQSRVNEMKLQHISAFFSQWSSLMRAVSLLIRYKFEEQFTLDEETASYIFSFTNGHPGGVSSVMEYIHDVCFRKRVGSTLDWPA